MCRCGEIDRDDFAMDVAYAVVHLLHQNAPLDSDERQSCGYCSRDHWRDIDGLWRQEWERRKRERSDG